MLQAYFAPLRRRWLIGVAWSAVLLGSAAATVYGFAGLTVSHYDAKAHLVVARRILDSLTPGWSQLGAIWLPLPHLLNALPVQLDLFYRTGFSAIALSVAGFGAAAVGLARIVYQLTGHRLAGVTAAAVFALNPSALYLQATPMTEALLYGFLALGVSFAIDAARENRLWPAGLLLAAACLTRYEAWPVTVALLAATGAAVARQRGARAALVHVTRLAMPALIGVGAFLVHARVTTGVWFVTGGFFVEENPARGHADLAVLQILHGLRMAAGPFTIAIGAAGLALAAVVAAVRPARRLAAVPLALLAAAALPWYAFLQGHPFRVRYMVVLVLAVAAGAGMAVAALPRRARWAAAGVTLAVALIETPPFSSPPALWEAAWDRPRSVERQQVTTCLHAGFRRPHDRILGSMVSLAPFIQELSHAGFRVADFVHEGTGVYWRAALKAPRFHVDWVLVDEREVVGDELARRARTQPSFTDGFERVCEGGGLALYRRRGADVLHAGR